MISQETIQQITTRIDILDIVGEFVKLKKRGTNYLGLCPFHHEKTPSFTVSPSKEIYKCFGCGKSGNTITFLMEHEKFSYVETLRWLANRYHITIEETVQSEAGKQLQQAAESLYIINHFAQKFFSTQLLQTEEGSTHAMAYLEERNFSKETIEKFQIGYSPKSRMAFYHAATEEVYNVSLLEKAGLIINRQNSWQDNYSGRIIFPIHHITGKIAGFGARVIGQADKSPKYINTPENEVYSKSRILYGLYFARHAIDKENECLLVEGYTDVIAMHQAGIENVVASSGTSLTTDQLRLIKKYSNHLTIIYDGDAAGIKAAMRGLDMAIEEGLQVNLVLLPGNEDPDSFLKNTGAQNFKDFIAKNKKDIILFQVEVLMKDAGNDIHKKNEVVNHIATSLSKLNRIEDFSKLQAYTRQCASVLHIDEEQLTMLINKYKRDTLSKKEQQYAPNTADILSPEKAVTQEQNIVVTESLREKDVLRVLLEHGLKPWDENRTIAAYIFEEVAEYGFANPELEKLFELYKQEFKNGHEPTTKSLMYAQDEKVRQQVIDITAFPYELSPQWSRVIKDKPDNSSEKDLYHDDVQLSLHYFKIEKLKEMFEQNQEELEKTTDPDEQMKLIEIHNHLKRIQLKLNDLGAVIIK
ncbi:MAG: DNA primase [Bacteroidetes bacterium]|nr:DNA primase [Bacteroidota bacterium]